MDARTLEVVHKKKYPGSLLTGARLKVLSEQIGMVTDTVMRKLMEDVRDSTTESISLYQETIDPAHFALLVELMKNQPALITNVNFGRNCLSPEMGAQLSDTLIHLSRLEALSLDFNMLGDRGVAAIANCVRVHNNLRSLRIRYNQIGEAGVDALAHAALTSKSLGTLEIGVRLPKFVTDHMNKNRVAMAKVKLKPPLRPDDHGHGKTGTPPKVPATTTTTTGAGGAVGSSLLESMYASEGVKPMALVISNINYSVNHLRGTKLYQPKQRADEMEAALTSHDFTVERHNHDDLNQLAFHRTLADFQSRCGPETIAVVYYAGHGTEALNSDGSYESYLIPVDERGVTDYHMKRTAVSVNDLMAGFGAHRCGIVLLVLDVCVAYPLSRHTAGDAGSAGGIGNIVVSPEHVQEGMFVITPCQPGTLPPGGVGDGGLFLRHAVRHIINKGLDVRGYLRRVSRGVSDESAGAQVPFTAFYTLSPDPLYLKPIVPQLFERSEDSTWSTTSLHDAISTLTAFPVEGK